MIIKTKVYNIHNVYILYIYMYKIYIQHNNITEKDKIFEKKTYIHILNSDHIFRDIFILLIECGSIKRSIFDY